MATGLIYNDRLLDHDTGVGHPERADRLRAIVRFLRENDLWESLHHPAFEAAPSESISAVHDGSYIDRVFAACREGMPYIDSPDSAICARSAEIAQLAAGGALRAADAVMGGDLANCFCALRPPGHHTERDRSMGFCLFNNVAITAQHLLDVHGLKRIAIVDFDVHHGNGTQHIFESRRDVLFISLHQDPRTLYPGTGFAEERGRGEGEGYTLNLPLPPGSDDAAFELCFQEHVLPRIEAYQPEFLLISAGFDAAAADPLANMNVTSDGFARMTEMLAGIAASSCEGRMISVLEGGYDLKALVEGVAAHVGVLRNVS